MLSATPARQRTSLSQSRPPPSARSKATPRSTVRATEGPEDRNGPELPEYQPPEFLITVEAQRQLHSLIENPHLELAQRHLHEAALSITNSAGEVSDRLRDAQLRYKKLKEKRRAEQDGQEHDAEGDDEEYQRLAEQEEKVNVMTGRLEEKMRYVVDSTERLGELKVALKDLHKEEAQAQQALLGARQTRSQRRVTRQHNEEEEDAEEEDDPLREPSPVRELRERNAQNPPTQRLNSTLAEGQKKWEELTLTRRYASNNDYIGFYRVVHDSKYPEDEAPPLPHSSTWFAHMEDPDADSGTRGTNGSPSSRRTRNQRQPSPAGSDDVAIERERISLECPITLLRFQDPVTSTKCPHSFEYQAIMDMISRSRPMPGGPSRVKAVKCPVCSIYLTANDFVRDTALQRRVRRAAAREAQRAEASDSDNEDEEQNPNRVTLASDAADPDDDDDTLDVDVPAGTQIKSEPVHIKGERSSQQPETDDESDEGEEGEQEEESGSDGAMEEDTDE